jgi:protease IV
VARRHPIVRGFLLLALAGLGLAGVLLAFAALTGEGLAGRFSLGPTVGVIELRGVIADATDALETLDRFRRSDATVAVVVRIDSPGGAVAPSQELYDAVWRLREAKPVVASLGNVAASGGYYVASAANVIVADPGTITGSIGAIMSLPLYASLAEKLGVSEQIVKSGPFKDTGHPLRPMTAEERAVLQAMVDDVLRQFVDAVARGRGMEPAQVRALADGRIYSGAQARDAGLVDVLGGLDAALRLAWERAGQSGEPKSYRVRLRRRTWWLELLGELIPEPRGVAGGLLFLYQGPALE